MLCARLVRVRLLSTAVRLFVRSVLEVALVFGRVADVERLLAFGRTACVLRVLAFVFEFPRILELLVVADPLFRDVRVAVAAG